MSSVGLASREFRDSRCLRAEIFDCSAVAEPHSLICAVFAHEIAMPSRNPQSSPQSASERQKRSRAMLERRNKVDEGTSDARRRSRREIKGKSARRREGRLSYARLPVLRALRPDDENRRGRRSQASEVSPQSRMQSRGLQNTMLLEYDSRQRRLEDSLAHSRRETLPRARRFRGLA